MTIEIRMPELEALIQQRMASGAFQSVEDVLMEALKSWPVPRLVERNSGSVQPKQNSPTF